MPYDIVSQSTILKFLKTLSPELPGSPRLSPPCDVEDTGSVPRQGTERSHATRHQAREPQLERSPGTATKTPEAAIRPNVAK